MAAPSFRILKHDRERAKREKAARKEARRRIRAGSERFPSAYPNAPEDVAGVGRTLSRGLPDA